MTGSYTPSGVFNPALPPAITATFLNNIEAWIKQVDNSTVVTLNGSTSGTAKLYQALNGTVKHVVVVLSNFRNGSAPALPLVLTTAFTTAFSIYAGNVSPLQLLASSSAQSFGIITALATAGGTASVISTLNKYSFGDAAAPCDTISFLGSQSTAYTGIMILQGI